MLEGKTIIYGIIPVNRVPYILRVKVFGLLVGVAIMAFKLMMYFPGASPLLTEYGNFSYENCKVMSLSRIH